MLMRMQQGSVWDLRVTAPGGARKGSGSPWPRSTGGGAASASGGAEGMMQNSGGKSM